MGIDRPESIEELISSRVKNPLFVLKLAKDICRRI